MDKLREAVGWINFVGEPVLEGWFTRRIDQWEKRLVRLRLSSKGNYFLLSYRAETALEPSGFAGLGKESSILIRYENHAYGLSFSIDKPLTRTGSSSPYLSGPFTCGIEQLKEWVVRMRQEIKILQYPEHFEEIKSELFYRFLFVSSLQILPKEISRIIFIFLFETIYFDFLNFEILKDVLELEAKYNIGRSGRSNRIEKV